MTTYYVTRVRKHQTNGHNHIIGVITRDNVFYENGAVVSSINRGDSWYTEVPGAPNARIKPLQYCPAAACYHSPYLTTDADPSAKNNLENLPPG